VKKLVEIWEREKEAEKKRKENGEGKESCQACGSEKETEKLSKCKGCESVWYCDKVGYVREMRGWVLRC
jgi:MYND finger